MIQKITIIDPGKAYYNHARDVDLMNNNDSYELSWEWPGDFGTGQMSRIKLNPGLSLGLGDFQVFEDFELHFESILRPVVFHFSFSRHANCGYSLVDKQDELYFAGPGLGGSIDYRKKWQGYFKLSQGVPVRGLAVFIDPLLLNPLICGQYERFPAILCDIVCGDREQYFSQTFIMPPAVQIAIDQVFDCPYNGPLKRFFLEAKSMELITYAMAQLAVDKYGHDSTGVLSFRDMERVRDIKEILLNNLNNPPSLMELARKSGTNKNKLNADFHKAFGASVFEFFRTSRLEHARTLLENKKMSVTEAAFEVGYAHQQSFTRAFRNHFGSNPVDHIR